MMDDALLHLIATGADSDHFANLRVLVGSWLTHREAHPLFVCDYGLSPGQRSELARIPRLEVLALDEPVRHPWLGKSYLGRFLGTRLPSAHTVMWIDADAFFNSPLPPLAPLIEGYDLLLDAHVQSVGELTHGSNLKRLGLRPDDAYFSAGWWIARPGRLFETYERLTALVRGQGHLWECDAFVAAIYAERLRIRTVSGLVWHARGKTSLGSCGVRDTTAYHGDQPIYVVHANDSYTVRDDGRRVLDRPDLARLQDRYEQRYRERIGIPSASGTRGPHPFVTGRG